MIPVDPSDGHPHWLSPLAKVDRKAIRAKHRAKHLASMRKPVRPETLAKLHAQHRRLAGEFSEPDSEAAIIRQYVSDRPATVAYIDSDFNPVPPADAAMARVVFDDGESAFLIIDEATHANDRGDAESQAWAKHRHKHSLPYSVQGHHRDEGDAEAEAWAKHREKHRRPYMVIIEGEPEPEPSVEHQLHAWAKAIMLLDASEVMVRDVIERDLSGIAGTGYPIPLRHINAVTDRLRKRITTIRMKAIKTAFRLVRDQLGDLTINDHSLAAWAQTILREDVKGIDSAIKTGLIAGLDNLEIARKVVGSMGLNGVDGITEFTRHKIAHLGRAAIKASNLRRMRKQP